MTLDFDIFNITETEFGVGREAEAEWTSTAVPMDRDVQLALQEMARKTWSEMQEKGDPVLYQPSEKHGSQEYLYVEKGNELEAMCRQLHTANNLTIDASALNKNEADGVQYYFARFVDDRKRHLTAIRRATYFKGILKRRLVQIISDTLKIVEDRTFKLDNDFDILVDSAYTHIWRPSTFEFVGKLQQAVLAAVPGNIHVIQQNMPFVDFKGIQQYASSHPRAARYLASIRMQNLAGIRQKELTTQCVEYWRKGQGSQRHVAN